jgi:signal transduction histidine kinase
LILGLLFRFGRMRRFPVRDLVEATRRLAEGDYSARVESFPGGPMKGLVDSFNGMARRLQDSSEQRRRLLADLGHELRNPLTVIQGEIEAMLDGVRPRQDAELKRLLGETQLLARLLEDLRTLSLTEAGELRLDRETVGMRVLLEEAARPFREEREIAIDCDPGEVSCDPLRIRQVLANILANAVRATGPGDTIRIEGRRGKVWTVTVSDPGRGIPPHELPHIFERFARAADSGGSGLGLSIARDLVGAHGGTITARSEPGRGTDLEFTLP